MARSREEKRVQAGSCPDSESGSLLSPPFSGPEPIRLRLQEKQRPGCSLGEAIHVGSPTSHASMPRQHHSRNDLEQTLCSLQPSSVGKEALKCSCSPLSNVVDGGPDEPKEGWWFREHVHWLTLTQTDIRNWMETPHRSKDCFLGPQKWDARMELS